MTDDELALLRAIVEQFDDDVPRLVYADWLEEHGRCPRAEFIRLQCHLHQALMNPNQREHFSRLIDNLQDFRSLHDETEFLVPEPEFQCSSWGDYQRGFPRTLRLDLIHRTSEPRADLPNLLKLHVPIESLELEIDECRWLEMVLAENLLAMCQSVEVGPQTCQNRRIFLELFEVLTETEWPKNVRAVRFAAWPDGSVWIQRLLGGNLHSLPKLSFPRADDRAVTIYPELVARLADRVQLH